MSTRSGLPLAVLAAAVVLAGCGSSKTVTVTTPVAGTTAPATTTPATTTPAATTPAATTPAATTPTTPTATTTTPSITASQLKAAEKADPAIKTEIAKAVASCKSYVSSTPNLKAADKASLDSICNKMSTGDTSGVQAATAQVCQQIVKDSVPAADQAAGLAACPKP